MDSLTALKTAIQTGSMAYDETQSVNAMLNRKMQRQTPFQVLEYLDKIVCAIIEGANQNLASSSSQNSLELSQQQQLPKIVFDALATVFKTWQNAALPTFISGACIDSDGKPVNSGVGAAAPIEQVRALPETLNRVLGVLGQLKSPSIISSKSPAAPIEKSAQLASHYSRYLFAQKFVTESAAKSLSDQNVRRARFFAQIAGVESYIFISSSLASTSTTSAGNISNLCSVIPEIFVEGEFEGSQSMAFSANTWLGDLLSSSSSSSSSQSSSTTILPPTFEVEALFLENVKRTLNLVARNFLSSSSTTSKVFVEPTLFSTLPPSLQTRCLVQLASRGLSRSAPASVLFRRLHSLGLSSSRPGFLFLTCVGLLTDAPSSQKRDKAIEELEYVYFLRKPSPPLAAENDLKKEFDAYVRECLAWKGGEASSATTTTTTTKKSGGVDMD